jgi:predicted alpha/beta hydrolase family esterase
MSAVSFTVLIVPGLRDHVEDHWQTHLAKRLARARIVPPLGRDSLDLAARVEAIEREARAIEEPLLVVAHSAGVPMIAHWAAFSSRAVLGALLAAPPDLNRPLPDGYPSVAALAAAGWLPVPRRPLPFPAIVAASRNDHLARFDDVAAMALDWGARLLDLGEVGHLNPASGYGPWQQAETIIAELAAEAAARS